MAAKEAQKRSASPPRGPALTVEDQKRLFQSLFFMNNADVNIIKGLVEKISNRWTDYPEFLCWAILSKKKSVVEYLLSDGASLSDPPTALTRDLVGLGQEIADAMQNYRRKPFIILAASSSSWEVVELLLSKGESLQQVGFVGLSKTRLNAVLTNALGAAVFYDKKEIVEGLLTRIPRGDPMLEFRTLEEKTISKSKTSMTKEYTHCTPFLLSVHRSDTPDVMEKLIKAGCAVNVVDWQGNSALHIAAATNKPELIKVLMTRKCDAMLARNQKGESPMSIATAKNFLNLLPLIQVEDSSNQAAQKLLDDLMAEEVKKEKKKRGRKQKKQEPVENSKQVEEVKEEKKEPSPPRPLKVVQLPPYRKPEKPAPVESEPPKSVESPPKSSDLPSASSDLPPKPVDSPPQASDLPSQPPAIEEGKEEKQPIVPPAPAVTAEAVPEPARNLEEPAGLFLNLQSLLEKVTSGQEASKSDLQELKVLMERSLKHIEMVL